MSSLPWKARVYIQVSTLLGILALICAFVIPSPVDMRAQTWESVAFVLLGAALGWKILNVMPGRRQANAGSVSLGFIIVFAAMLRFGVLGAVLTGIATALVASLNYRHLWYQTLFNVATSILQGFIAALIFVALNYNSLTLHLSTSLPALVASSLTFFLINSFSVALVIGFCSNKPVLALWEENFLWTAPGYFLGGAVSVLSMGLLGGTIPTTILCLGPILYLTHWSFRKHLDRTQELVDSQERLSTLYQAATRSLALAIDAKDRYTHQHILRVQHYAVAIATEMGISGDALHAIEVGALLHDIGKLGIPEEVLLKPGRLTNEEFELIKQHPRIGAEILEPVPFPWPVLPVVKYHHERWDGTGYPEQLKGEDIPLSARILAVADVYDALTTDRSYRGAWTHERAVTEISKQAGKQFDPVVVEKFLAVIDTVIAAHPLPEFAMIPQPEEERTPSPTPSRTLAVGARPEETLVPVGAQ